ncbi:hypothetical protein LH23_14255 [Cedecea neteri]|uniref:Uncharacterized protein n=1 Tax=Cedecea neteri TaxID=158822 RepID=A0AAN0S5W7_9ENTR|nr:hypothetical protein [Cedecea neteri]AIR61772.1 hypothetical protein LH23_14255 [Cedecea neteri]
MELIDTIIEKVQYSKTRYFYKPLKKLKQYDNQYYDLFNDGDSQEYVISDVPFDESNYIHKEQIIVTLIYNRFDKSQFTLEVIVNDELISTATLPNIEEMEEDEKFQQSLVYDCSYINFTDLENIQSVLVKHYHLRSVGSTHIKDEK